jgi:NAD(P)-dependent dehydrogenase (short-subunit alcohol dehydrogenase family)
MIISKSNLTQESLKGEIAIVTGAGRGIGYEAAKALVWLGANVVIVEIDEKNGKAAEDAINREFGAGKAFFVETDIGSEKDIDKLAEVEQKKFGKVDIVLNNATVFPMGTVKDTPVESWDFSYRVNLRGPVVLARKFLTAMIQRKHGIFVCVSSSDAAPFMGHTRSSRQPKLNYPIPYPLKWKALEFTLSQLVQESPRRQGLLKAGER